MLSAVLDESKSDAFKMSAVPKVLCSMSAVASTNRVNKRLFVFAGKNKSFLIPNVFPCFSFFITVRAMRCCDCLSKGIQLNLPKPMLLKLAVGNLTSIKQSVSFTPAGKLSDALLNLGPMIGFPCSSKS